MCPCWQGQGVPAYLTPPHPRPGRVPSGCGWEKVPRLREWRSPAPARCMTGAREEIPSPALGLPLPKGLLCLQSSAGPEPVLLLGTDHLLWPVQVPVMLKSQPIFPLKQAQPVTLGTARSLAWEVAPACARVPAWGPVSQMSRGLGLGGGSCRAAWGPGPCSECAAPLQQEGLASTRPPMCWV